MSPAPSGSLARQHVKLGDALEIHDGIIFKFNSGLPHVLYMWHSRIEIEYYSVAYFERITKFDAL